MNWAPSLCHNAQGMRGWGSPVGSALVAAGAVGALPAAPDSDVPALET